MRKRHKGPEEEHDALVGTGKARNRNQPWDEHEASSDFMSQVGNPVFRMCCHLRVDGLEGMPEFTLPSQACGTYLLHRNCRNDCLSARGTVP